MSEFEGASEGNPRATVIRVDVERVGDEWQYIVCLPDWLRLFDPAEAAYMLHGAADEATAFAAQLGPHPDDEEATRVVRLVPKGGDDGGSDNAA